MLRINSTTATTSPLLAWQRISLCALYGLLVVRLMLMGWVPLTDTTEARYAEIARKMLETGNWVTPLHDYGIPFWAKPPLSTWLSALSMGLLGQTEFAVRLPSLLLSLGVLWLVGSLVFRRAGRDMALITVLMLASSLFFFVSAGAVMTDPALVFCTTLILVAFWRAVVDGDGIWGYAFFLGIGLGLLAKGPIAIVLSGMPLFFWVLLRRQWLPLWQRLPWVRGSLLAALVAVPWYIWAEIRTPGFLDYFIMGEHVQRFLDPGWQGDKYGFAHATPHGMIWLFAVAALLPWSLVAPLWIWRSLKQPRAQAADDGGWLTFLLLWACLPLAFFSLSGNIIFPYTLPMLPAACLLFAELWNRTRRHDAPPRLPWLAIAVVVLGIVLILLQAAVPERLLRTQKAVIAQWHALQPDADSQLIYWSKRREFSSEFYSSGRTRATHDAEALKRLLGPARNFVAVSAGDVSELPNELQSRLERLAEIKVKGDTVLILGDARTEQETPTTGKEMP
ncbi:phospholipid carrier-dependent glycosyltransferase [Pseudomonas sp. No.21]|uniref:ArnT family glycosyltransferase n=1 Tax=Pseudomonas TaxID=286 RepID=UPI000DA7A7C0|nr:MULTISPECIES: glycosyltransferase family 39 protein [Pseudomonas]MDW3713292.1 glycosyltransferase family 39 protein [Pseudomonas sp. 2023EL-01195]PZE12010.1 dolichyl-phosphate-mannose--protein mannosyltransferase [Pseudomonas sp. 57B-090624]GJN45712.1 phospholipid carrier-dependent glycosyltransferase [Pseudomonas tohonis]